MDTNYFIHHELRVLENSARAALCNIRQAKTIRDVVHSMSVPVPAVVRALRRLAPSYPKIDQEAHRRAESIVRIQIGNLATIADEDEFLRQRARFQAEWRLLGGRFPKAASYVHIESSRILSRLRTQSTFPSNHTNQ